MEVGLCQRLANKDARAVASPWFRPTQEAASARHLGANYLRLISVAYDRHNWVVELPGAYQPSGFAATLLRKGYWSRKPPKNGTGATMHNAASARRPLPQTPETLPHPAAEVARVAANQAGELHVAVKHRCQTYVRLQTDLMRARWC